jgi:hypothetical protein
MHRIEAGPAWKTFIMNQLMLDRTVAVFFLNAGVSPACGKKREESPNSTERCAG